MLSKSLNRAWFKKRSSTVHKRLGYGLVIAIFLTTGCTMVGPDFVKPEAPVETEWWESRDPEIKTAPSDYKAWWSVFNDPVLDSLVEAAYQQNLTLQISGIRIPFFIDKSAEGTVFFIDFDADSFLFFVPEQFELNGFALILVLDYFHKLGVGFHTCSIGFDNKVSHL